jgi:aldehyde dehydrogenase (NAD+)
VHSTQSAHVTLAMNEAFGVMGLICPDEAPLLGFLSTLLPAIAMGNRVVAVPSQSAPGAALDLVQVMETSDLPGGVVNIVTGDQAELGKVLAQHDDVAALWAFAPRELCTVLEREAAGNLKPVWCEWAMRVWSGAAGQGEEFLQNATQRKTIWVPYGA